MFVFPDAVVLGRNAAARFHCRRFHGHQPGAADCAAAEVYQMPVVGDAVLARILAHRRDRDAVPESDAAQRKRREKVSAHSFSISTPLADSRHR